MNNFIEYYYNIVNITVHKKDNYYYFYNGNIIYTFMPTKRTMEELIAIYKLLNFDNRYNKIILNKNKLPITNYKNNQYVLIKLLYKNEKIYLKDLKKNKLNMAKDFTSILRNNWNYLLSKKIDYIEYQRYHLEDKYRKLYEILDYYIGMAENSISYLNTTIINEKGNIMDDLVISHRRIESIEKNSFYNPLDIIIDHPSRDISEYLKRIFIDEMYSMEKIKEIFAGLKLSKFGWQLLYGRMLYPSFFFDCYEKIINDKKPVEIIYSIIDRSKEYELYLYNIYVLINEKIKIPKIDWV